MPHTAGRYIAEERGAFDAAAVPVEKPAAEPELKPATATLAEVAMAHMLTEEQVRFYRWYGDLE